MQISTETENHKYREKVETDRNNFCKWIIAYILMESVNPLELRSVKTILEQI